jgi:hypothetical protein
MPRRRLEGEEVQLLLILDLGTKWGEWSATHPVSALPAGKGPPVPIVQKAGWALEPVWTQRLEETCEISSSHGGEYDVQSCLLGYTAV